MTNPWHPRGPQSGPGGSPNPNAPQTTSDAHGPHDAGPGLRPYPASPSQPYQAARPLPPPSPSPFAQPPPIRPSQHRVHVPDPTVIVMRPRRPRGLVISMSVLVTLGLVVGGLLAYGNLNQTTATSSADQSADNTAAREPAAGTAGQVAAVQAQDPVGQAGAVIPTIEPAAEPAAAPSGAPGEAPAPAAIEQLGAAVAQAPPAPVDPAPRGSQALAVPGTGAADTIRPAPDPAPAWLQLTVEPADATVTVGGDTYGGASLQRMGPFKPGPHQIVIAAPGHERLEQIVELDPGETERMSLALPPLQRGQGKIRVRSKPSGATVLIDGNVRGLTPLVLELEAGRTYELALSQQGYEPWRTLIEPAVGKTQRFGADMVRVARARTEPARSSDDPPRAPEAPSPGAATAKAPLPDEPAAKKERDVHVPASVVGKASRGRSLVERCRSCHGSSAPALNPRVYTQSQWSRFLALRRHSRHAELRPLFSASELADVKAYLLENAADVDRGMAAGVR